MNEEKKRTIVSDAAFVLAYSNCKSSEDVASTLGLEVGSVQSRACKLRKAGVNLPKFKRNKKEVDVQGLNELIGQQENISQ